MWLLASGKQINHIAAEMFLSPSTISTYRPASQETEADGTTLRLSVTRSSISSFKPLPVRPRRRADQAIRSNEWLSSWTATSSSRFTTKRSSSHDSGRGAGTLS